MFTSNMEKLHIFVRQTGITPGVASFYKDMGNCRQRVGVLKEQSIYFQFKVYILWVHEKVQICIALP